MTSRHRIGIFGGAFDPPHRGHFNIAQAAIDQCNLDMLYIFPTGDAWHKERMLTKAAHRLAMTKLCFESLPKARVDTREIDRSTPTYTIDTIVDLRKEHPQSDLFLFVGQDQAQIFHTWKSADLLLNMTTLYVAARFYGSAAPEVLGKIDKNPKLLTLATDGVSSSQVRHLIEMHQSLEGFLHQNVMDYVHQHHLYALC